MVQIQRSGQSGGTIDSVTFPPHFMVHVPPVQHRSGTNDCATFAIAFAVLGSFNTVKLHDQSQMRQYLLSYLSKGEMFRITVTPGLVCAHGTTILTNREPSELVEECIFMPSRLGHGL